ncbi:MAG: hypothetical protein KGL38_01960 [Gemmatimonadota bacterium]|nr:hypothetical protein [Gemmatimonadota bacterium]MDE3171621.1 hypothetical protein [Gemmatimonadota bacterium]MDE3215019.1 hypothetical protein [Gemmatimonadota bacterium]
MPRSSLSPRSTFRPAAAGASARRGFALGVALIFTLVIGALATAAIILTSNATLLAKSVEHQRDLKYAAEAGLQMVKSRLDRNATLLPDSGQSQLMTGATVYSADGIAVPGIRVNVWVGPSGSLSGQYGNFASIVSQAVDNIGVSYVQRLDVIQESFARYAYWSNSETGPYGTIYFQGGDQLWGPVWSNDVLHIGSTGATFHDSVGTAQYVSGAGYGTFMKGYLQYQRPVPLPTTTTLSRLSSYASSAGYNFTAPTIGDETTVLMRVEFVATDLNADGDSLDDNEGFFRVYVANAGKQAWLRGDYPATTSVANYTNCGDWHTVAGYADKKFFPAAVHPTTWFRQLMQASGMSAGAAAAESSATVATIMQHTGARCYPGGDPHLVAIARNTLPYLPSQWQKGGDDTTFTATGANGYWVRYTTTPAAVVAAKRADAMYLFPLSRSLNANYKGVVYVAGTTGVSGTVRGRTTLYAHSGDIVLLDDVRYAHDPSLNTCDDVLGLIADNDAVVADNGINTPQNVNPGGSTIWRSLDDTQDMYLQAVTMALNTSFRVQNFQYGPTSALYCQGAPIGRGCLYVTGGIIQVVRGPVGTSTGSGFSKQYGYDACAGSYPPPYFPTTGRFTDNRYYEVNPIGFNVVSLFKSISSGS